MRAGRDVELVGVGDSTLGGEPCRETGAQHREPELLDGGSTATGEQIGDVDRHRRQV